LAAMASIFELGYLLRIYLTHVRLEIISRFSRQIAMSGSELAFSRRRVLSESQTDTPLQEIGRSTGLVRS